MILNYSVSVYSIQLFYAERHTALLLYTANSTGPPRGLLYRHYNLNAQADGIVQVIVLVVLLPN